MNRWAVRKLHPHICGPDGTAWVAGEVGKWHNTVCSFRTYEEAMAYADKRARTREVVLPRDTARPSEHLEIGPMCWGGAVVTTVDDGVPLLLTREEIRPLALALLAHAERMEE